MLTQGLLLHFLASVNTAAGQSEHGGTRDSAAAEDYYTRGLYSSRGGGARREGDELKAPFDT